MPLEYGEEVSSPPPAVKPASDGKFTFWIPDSASVVVAEAEKLPDLPACGLM